MPNLIDLTTQEQLQIVENGRRLVALAKALIPETVLYNDTKQDKITYAKLYLEPQAAIQLRHAPDYRDKMKELAPFSYRDRYVPAFYIPGQFIEVFDSREAIDLTVLTFWLKAKMNNLSLSILRIKPA